MNCKAGTEGYEGCFKSCKVQDTHPEFPQDERDYENALMELDKEIKTEL